MNRVPWSEVAPDDFERSLGVFLGNRFPNAQRMRASRGDRGVDIFVPLPGELLDVYQAKRYTGDLTSGRKAEILHSVETAAAHFGGRINEWHLVIGIDPTPEIYDWFKTEIEDTYPFDCYWNGITYLDGLAADHPHVVDYYFGNGAAELRQRLDTVNTVLSLQDLAVAGDDIIADDIVGELGAIVAVVNRSDPHYDYHFATGPTRPSVEEVGRSGAVFSCSQVVNGTTVTITVHQKYSGATRDRPLPITTNLTIPAGSPKLEEINDFLDYGTPVTLDASVVSSITADLPGGLAFSEASPTMLRFTYPIPPADDQPTMIKLRVNDPDHKPATTVLRSLGHGQGQRGGRHGRFQDLAGFAQYEFRFGPDGTAASSGMQVNRTPIHGQAAASIAGSARVATCLALGARIEIIDVVTERVLGEVQAKSPDDDFAKELLEELERCEYLDDIADLQALTSTTLIVPDHCSGQQRQETTKPLGSPEERRSNAHGRPSMAFSSTAIEARSSSQQSSMACSFRWSTTSVSTLLSATSISVLSNRSC